MLLLFALFVMIGMAAYCMKITAPASLEEINNIASIEELRVAKGKATASKENLSSSESFEVWGLLFCCTYTRTYEFHDANAPFETIKVGIFFRRGFLKATFRKGKMTEWEDRWVLQKDAGPHERWLFEHLLAVIQNAVSTKEAILL